MSGKLLAVFLVVAAVLLGGCAPLVFTAGAGAGYVATQEKPRNKVEAFFDDLGRSIKQTTRKLTGEEPAKRQRQAKTGGGLTLKIHKSALTPTKVNKGEQVQLVLQYSVAGAAKQGVKVREKSSLLRNGKELTVLKDESNERENGTWENTLTFAVPESAEPGKYTVILRVSAQGQTRNAQRSFTVR